MPASLRSATAPEPAPEPDRPKLAAAPPEPASRGKWIALACVLLCLGAAAWWLRPGAPKQAPKVAIRTVRPTRGALRQMLRVAGNVVARRYANIIAPRLQAPETRTMDLITLAANGSYVKKDQVVATIDSRAMRDHLDDIEAQADQNELEILRLDANQAAEIERIRQLARNARASLEQARLNARAIPTRTAIDQELLRLAVEEADINYREAERQTTLYLERQAAQRKVAQLNRESILRHRDRHRNDVVRCTIITPLSGQVVLGTISRGRGQESAQVRAGEQVTPGQLFMSVVDPSSMQVDASVNQSEIERMRIGQRATVRFDAYPDLVMDGKVEGVGSLATSGRRSNYYVRRVPVRLVIEGADPRVIPDLSAIADVVIGSEDDALLVPREAVHEENGKSLVYVRQGDGGFAAREVAIGAVNNTHAAVVSGLQGGEDIAIQPLQN
jgi:multidrug resistance efflux pump